MSEIVNLRQARKRAERARREAEAAENRAKYGECKASREVRAAEDSRLRKTVDQAKLEEEP